MEEKIEKEIINNLEKKNKDPTFSIITTEIPPSYTEDTINTSNNINTYVLHFNREESEIKSQMKMKFKKLKFYNHKIGTFTYKTSTDKPSLYKQSYISKRLEENEILNVIKYDDKMTQQSEENFYPMFYKYLDNYRDIQVNQSDLEMRTQMMKIYLFHILNHIFKRKEQIELNDNIDKIVNDTATSKEEIVTKELFISHEAEFISQYHDEHKQQQNNNGQFVPYQMNIDKQYKVNQTEGVNIKDQGFTYPKCLILVPYKKHARLIMEEIVNIFSKGSWKGISNKKKFKEEYSEFDSEDDCFRMGINISYFDNKIKLYTPFDESDIIIASPLGLKLSNPNNNNEDSAAKNRKIYDFLSSIEILLVDFAEVFIYQNIEHLNEILSFLNKMPKNNQNIVSIDRINDNFIKGLSQNLRQSIFVSHFKSLDIDMIINEYCSNINGIVNITEDYQNQVEKIKHELSEKHSDVNANEYEIRFEFKMLIHLKGENPYDDKFNYFTKSIWNNLYESFDRHTLIFVASPFDFLRLKSFYKQYSKSVLFINEDSDKKDWQRNRLYFEQARFKFLLYSERGHFYKKINLRFAKNIFFYSLPEDPNIFTEIVNMIDPVHYRECIEKYEVPEKESEYQQFGSVIALVSPIEKYQIEKILGKIGNKIIKQKMEYYSC